MALKRLKAKTGRLEEAFEFKGRFSDHHGFLLRTMLGRIDGLSADIAVVDDRIEEQVSPFWRVSDGLCKGLLLTRKENDDRDRQTRP